MGINESTRMGIDFGMEQEELIETILQNEELNQVIEPAYLSSISCHRMSVGLSLHIRTLRMNLLPAWIVRCSWCSPLIEQHVRLTLEYFL